MPREHAFLAGATAPVAHGPCATAAAGHAHDACIGGCGGPQQGNFLTSGSVPLGAVPDARGLGGDHPWPCGRVFAPGDRIEGRPFAPTESFEVARNSGRGGYRAGESDNAARRRSRHATTKGQGLSDITGAVSMP